MKESYGEDLASHSGLDPYADHGNVVGVASARGTGRPAIELRNQTFRVPTLWCLREGNNCIGVMASQGRTRRSRRTCACLKTPSARTGRSLRFPTLYESGRLVNASGDTTNMYVAGKSDELVVLMTQANKRGWNSCERSLSREGVRPRETDRKRAWPDTVPGHMLTCKRCSARDVVSTFDPR